LSLKVVGITGRRSHQILVNPFNNQLVTWLKPLAIFWLSEPDLSVHILQMQPARLLILAVILCCLGQSTLNSLAQTRDEKVRQDRSTVQADGQWIYNDLNLALAEAKRDNKPILATFRCIP